MRPRTLLAAIALLACAFALQARTIQEIRQSGKLLAATEGAFAPFNFFEGSKLTGFEVELAELVARRMGLAIEWKTLGFDALLTGESTFAELPAVLPRLTSGELPALCHLITYPTGE